MNFATAGYALFLVLVVVAYWLMPRSAGRYWLILASLVFYATWNPLYVPGFVALIIVNWALGLLAEHHGRLAIGLAIGVNLGLLAIFKYADWLLGSTASLIARLTGEPPAFDAMGLILPLAISFVTFTMLAYVIDTARGHLPERRLSRFALFVTFFPHLIAGPIMRGREFLPQIRHPRPWTIHHLRVALPLLVGGLAKKILGDNLAPGVEQVFADPMSHGTLSIWLGILAFAMQIFLDFSGYTDLALGSAHLLGFQLPRNFDWPYRSLSIQEFWRRWHMTLSRWLRDYVYFTFGGSRHGRARTYLALLGTMLLGGLWHGAGITFVLWGGWHGLGLAVNRAQRDIRGARPLLPGALAWAVTFVFVLVGWVLFRATSLENAGDVFARALTLSSGPKVLPLGVAVLSLALVVGQLPVLARLFERVAPVASPQRYLAYGAVVATAILLMPVQATEFIYFQF